MRSDSVEPLKRIYSGEVALGKKEEHERGLWFGGQFLNILEERRPGHKK